MIALLVITDGRRDCIAETIPSALAHLHGHLAPRVIYDDSGDAEHTGWLMDHFEPLGFTVVAHEDGRRGFGGAIQAAWKYLLATTLNDPARFVFHLEDDFTFNRDVDLDELADVLDERPELVQLALRRQAWNDAERAAGGVIEQHPDAYSDVESDGRRWLEHRLFFTTNPSLYRRSLCATDWPDGPQSEGRFTHQLLEHGLHDIAGEELRFGFWGSRDSGEWVTHIGHERVGTGY